MGQITAITWLNLRNIGARFASSAVVITGIGGVVAVLLGLLAMSSGFQAALVDTARPDRALVLRGSSSNEMDGWITPQEMNVLQTMPAFEVVSGEVYVTLNARLRSAGTAADVVGRGVTEAAFKLRPEVEIVAGRRFAPGRNEVIVGSKAVALYEGMAIGDTIESRTSLLRVVGVFTAAGTAVESEIWVDLPIAQDAFRRTFSVARVRLKDPADLADLTASVDKDPRLDTVLIGESTFYAEQSAAQTVLIETFAYLIAGIMALGAIVAALNTMYTAVGQRTVEIGTLRALGFSRASVVISVLVESTLLAVIGSLIAATLVYTALNGYTTSTQNSASGNQLAFAFQVTPELFRLGIGCALGLGLIGGLFPAIRAVRIPITQALRGG